MRLTNELVVPASLDEVWAVLLDVARIAPCLPGASIEAGDGDEYRGTMKVRLGPITSSFQGTIRIEEADESARRAVMSAKARDSRGQGTATATITSTMEPAEDAGTRITVETDLRVTGPAASFGRGVMQDVSARLMGQFADCLAAEIGRSAQSAGAAATGAPARARPRARRRRRAAKESRWRARCLPMFRSRHRPRRGCAGPPERELATSTGPPPASGSSFPTGATTKRSTSVRSGARRSFAGWLPWPPRPRSCS